jgi:hypothetical protein
MAMVLSFWAGMGPWSLAGTRSPVAFAQQAEPTPTADPLDIPELPENPTQIDIGRHSYYYNCMPCHGDQGQGLTDAWRATWVDDHQDCWARGCHAGRSEDGGFPIPTVVPAVVDPANALSHFPSAGALHDYLDETHPPQRPGVLPEEEYWALTAFLLAENQRLPAGTELGSAAADEDGSDPSSTPAGAGPVDEMTTAIDGEGFNFAPAGIVLASGFLAGIVVILIWRRRRATDQ